MHRCAVVILTEHCTTQMKRQSAFWLNGSVIEPNTRFISLTLCLSPDLIIDRMENFYACAVHKCYQFYCDNDKT